MHDVNDAISAENDWMCFCHMGHALYMLDGGRANSYSIVGRIHTDVYYLPEAMRREC